MIAPYSIPLVLRVVQPLAVRGGKLPAAKQMYIIRDAKRKPIGSASRSASCAIRWPVLDRCIAIAKWADARGALLAFAKSAMRGDRAEARDVGEYVDLRFIVERAGLPWDEAKAALDDPEAPKWAQAAATDMAVKLWGVPSFKVGDFVAWGQDRLPLLADRLRRNASATAA